MDKVTNLCRLRECLFVSLKVAFDVEDLCSLLFFHFLCPALLFFSGWIKWSLAIQ